MLSSSLFYYCYYYRRW